jgi:hypothetical protein
MPAKTHLSTWILLFATLLLTVASTSAEDKPVTVSLNVNAMSTGDEAAHRRLEADTRRMLEERLSSLSGLEVVRSNADLLLSVSIIQVEDELFTCVSMSFAFSPACIGLVLFETGVFGKQTGIGRVVDLIVRDFDVNTLVPYKRTRG